MPYTKIPCINDIRNGSKSIARSLLVFNFHGNRSNLKINSNNIYCAKTENQLNKETNRN